MKTGWLLGAAIFVRMTLVLDADEVAKVTEAINEVDHGTSAESGAPAHAGTLVRSGEYLRTGSASRAEMLLPSTSIARLGPETIYNFFTDQNLIDVKAGTILFCKPKNSSDRLDIRTAAVTAGITGTTGFMSIQGSGHRTTYVFGIIEGHALASADGKPFLVETGEILEFQPGKQPIKFAFDLPRFVRSSPLLHKYKSALPNQAQIDHAVAEYNDDLSRGFITKPKGSIDYSGDIPLYSPAALDSAQNSNGAKAPPPPPPPPSSYRNPSSFGP